MTFLKQFKWTLVAIKSEVSRLCTDLHHYYITPYPFLLIFGAIRRLTRRLKIIWVPRSPGRPPISETLVDLILDMKRSNLGWGALRISQELALLGISCSKKTVVKVLRGNGYLPPKTRFIPPPWGTYISNLKQTWGMDFTCVFDYLGIQVFILVIIETSTRELILINATFHPTKEWLIQQFRNAAISNYEFPTTLIVDNDGIYGKWIDPTLKEQFGIDVKRIRYHMPWMNGVCERFHFSLKNEVMNRVGGISLSMIQKFGFLYRNYYNQIRPHQGIQGQTPAGNLKSHHSTLDVENFKYFKIKEIDGLITRFQIAA